MKSMLYRMTYHKLFEKLSIQWVWVHVSSHESELSCTAMHISRRMDAGGQIDMQYISMTELWGRGHEAGVCTRTHGGLNSYGAHPSGARITQHRHASAFWLISQRMAQQQISSGASRFMCEDLSLFFFHTVQPQCTASCILKQDIPGKVFSGMEVKHITDCHESHESSEDVFLVKTAVF